MAIAPQTQHPASQCGAGPPGFLPHNTCSVSHGSPRPTVSASDLPSKRAASYIEGLKAKARTGKAAPGELQAASHVLMSSLGQADRHKLTQGLGLGKHADAASAAEALHNHLQSSRPKNIAADLREHIAKLGSLIDQHRNAREGLERGSNAFGSNLDKTNALWDRLHAARQKLADNLKGLDKPGREDYLSRLKDATARLGQPQAIRSGLASGATGAPAQIAQRLADARERLKAGMASPAGETPSKPRGTPDRKATAERLKAVRAKLGGSKQLQPGQVGSLPTSDVHFDPERFQYKLGANHKTGSVGSLSGVKKYDPSLAGVLQVWKDPADGKTYVVNGHNRLDKAKELGASHVNVMHLNAANHKEARAMGALTNIAEGRGTSLDAAKFFRDMSEGKHGEPTKFTRADLEQHGIPLREKTATEGLALAGLEAPLFRKVIDGELPENRGAVIGGSGLSGPQQMDLWKHAESKGAKGLTDRDLKEFIDNAKAAGSTSRKTASLFGDDEDEVALGLHRAKVQGHIKERLGREKRLFGTVAKSKAAAELARAGNTINTEESGKVADQASHALGVFDTLKNSAGPIASHLSKAAERIANGEKPSVVHSETYQNVLDSLESAMRF